MRLEAARVVSQLVIQENSIPEPNTGCWLWTGSSYGQGYGAYSSGGRTVRAHRLAYEAFVGKIPEGLTIDHLCRVRCCVNPQHLEPVTMGVNVLRGESFSARQKRQTHCFRGHSLSGENLRVDRGSLRICVACKRISRLVWNQNVRGRQWAACEQCGNKTLYCQRYDGSHLKHTPACVLKCIDCDPVPILREAE